MEIRLKHWIFGLGQTDACLNTGREVSIPHTWNVEEGSEEYWGTGWYACDLDIPEKWAEKRVWVKFSAVYHDAVIYLNGTEIGRHENSGYTPFTVELTKELRCGAKNRLTVSVSNEFSSKMLPYERSFDWANDGGMIRDVLLFTTGDYCFLNTKVTAKPVITEKNRRQDGGYAIWGADMGIFGPLDQNEWKSSHAQQKQRTQQSQGAQKNQERLHLNWELFQGTEGSKKRIAQGDEDCMALILKESFNGSDKIAQAQDIKLRLPGRMLKDIEYWHFDHPALYTLHLILKQGEQTEDEKEIIFGFRDFTVRGPKFFLNGEPVRLCGTEWMPGSTPEYGMAEPKEQLENMLICLKESNCIFTRFHWQQDDAVLDWCDRHGMLIQEEVPFWGKAPEKIEAAQWNACKQQIEEMYAAHCNHPSIIFWGIGNELDAQDEDTIRYIKNAVAYTHRLDETRSVNYVSNTWSENGALDGVTDGDVMMVNDYIGTWAGDLDEEEELRRILSANPDKPLVPSEFGLCEPAFSGGDARREAMFLEKIDNYRRHSAIAGSIYFCLNDYRTQMGEDGEGKFRKRIHGSTELDGKTKPSYYVVQRECAPFLLEWETDRIKLSCRDDLPCYEMRGYRLKQYNASGSCIAEEEIPKLHPGERWSCECKGAVKAAVYRPTGDWAGTFGR